MIAIAASSAHQIPLPDETVHTVVTSPPYYSLRKYAGEQEIEWPAVSYAPMPGLGPVEIPAMTSALGLEPTPEAYIGHLVLCFREVRRVLRDDGVAWCVIGDDYKDGQLQMTPHRLALALQGDGWTCRNDVVWAKKSPMPESVSGWRFQDGKLRRGSWRHTRAHEFVLMLTKGMAYFCDQEKVREAIQPESYKRFDSAHSGEADSTKHQILGGTY